MDLIYGGNIARYMDIKIIFDMTLDKIKKMCYTLSVNRKEKR